MTITGQIMKRLALVLLLAGCPKTAAPVQDASPVASAAPSASASAVAASRRVPDLVDVVHAWNGATNGHDGTKLGSVYADSLDLYGTKMTREKAVAVKEAAFAKHDRDDLGPVTVIGNTATFQKKSKAKDGKVIEVSGYIEVDASMKIIAEGDTTTDANLSRKKQSQCSAAVVALIESTPKGQRSAEDAITIDPPLPGASVWKVRYIQIIGGERIDHYTVQGLQAWSTHFEVDAKAGTVTNTGVTVDGPAEDEHSSHPAADALTVDPAAATKVRSICN